NEAARGFLQQRGIPAEAATWLASRLGGNPLTLRMATQLFQQTAAQDKNGGLSGFAGPLAGQGDAAEIQRPLYVRILEHVHDPDVRRLAHPGLVLRKVTADIIRDVLAERCGVVISTPKRAEELFAELARETSLVSLVRVSGVDELRHRPDVRRVML